MPASPTRDNDLEPAADAVADVGVASAARSASTRFQRVQVLRFVAALGVVLFHASAYLQRAGADAGPLVRFFDHHFSWGVQLFFVISGFVIAQTIERMPVRKFAAHRFLRIYPAYWLAVALAIVLQWALLGRTSGASDLGRALTLLPFGRMDYPLAVEWTLVYEVFFYVLVCVVALAGWKRARNVLLVIWPIAIVVAFVLRTPPSAPVSIIPSIDRILFSGYNLLFIAGMLVQRVHLTVPVQVRRYALVVAPVFILLTDLMSLRAVPSFASHAVGFGAIVLWAVLADRARPLSARNPFATLGDWSYGLYLVHVPFITLAIGLGFGAGLPVTLAFVGLASGALIVGSAFGAFEVRLYRWLVRIAGVRK